MLSIFVKSVSSRAAYIQHRATCTDTWFISYFYNAQNVYCSCIAESVLHGLLLGLLKQDTNEIYRNFTILHLKVVTVGLVYNK